MSDEKNSLSSKDLKKLKIWHTAAAVFMSVQTVAIFALSLDVEVPLSVGFPDRDGRDGPVGFIKVKEIDGFQPKYIIGSFLLLSAVDHLIMATLLWANLPHGFLARNTNPVRWIEYTFSASLMSFLVASLSGIYDIHSLLSIALFTGITMIFGWLLELIPREDEDYHKLAVGLFTLGSFTCLFSWLPIFCYFFEAVSNDVPGFVIAAFFGTFIAYSCFALNMYLYYFPKLYGFITSEMIYVVLSFTAKTFLAWDVWGGFKASDDD